MSTKRRPIEFVAIAQSLGYGSDSAFAASFRRVLGQSPARYRSMYRDKTRSKVRHTRYTVALLMRPLGLQGILRGKPVNTSASDKADHGQVDVLANNAGIAVFEMAET
jgi:hypothetical protein